MELLEKSIVFGQTAAALAITDEVGTKMFSIMSQKNGQVLLKKLVSKNLITEEESTDFEKQILDSTLPVQGFLDDALSMEKGILNAKSISEEKLENSLLFAEDKEEIKKALKEVASTLPTEEERPCFRMCKSCGEHGTIFLKGGLDSSHHTIESKQVAMEFLDSAKADNLITEGDYQKVAEEISASPLRFNNI